MSGKGEDSKDNATTATNTPKVLREQAEARLGKTAAFSSESMAELTPDAARQLLYELRVHQIELEMQNEELRESQNALTSLQARYFDLYDLAPLGYLLINEQGLISQANLTAASLLGLSRSELVNKTLTQIVFKQDQDVLYLNRKLLAETGHARSFELRIKRFDGRHFWAQLYVTAANDTEGEPELRIALSNIDERKQLEADSKHLKHVLKMKNSELEHTRALAEKASQAKSDFLSRMSHELRTPLNAILGFTQLIDSGAQEPTPSQKRSLTQILKAGWYLLDLINEVLDLATIESGKLALSLMPVLLSEVMQECQEMIAVQAESREIRLHFPSGQKQYTVLADHTRLKQVMINLLSNAIKYNKIGGSIIVSYEAKTSRRVRICVADTGIGLSVESLSHLYEPFNRLGLDHHTEAGTGIGLVVSKRLVELMNGEIGAESTLGLGSVFWFEIDLVASA